MEYYKQVSRVLMAGTMIVAGISMSGMALAADDDTNRSGAGPNDEYRVYLDRPVHPTAQELGNALCPTPQLWQGDGNPPTNFQRKRNLDAGVELAIKGIIRGGADIPSSYVDKHGLVHIEVPTGQDPSTLPPGSGPGNPADRAAWNFTYSYDVALDPTNPTLDQYEGELWVDLDASEKTKYLKLELVPTGAPSSQSCVPGVRDFSGFGWEHKGTVLIPDDEGGVSRKVTQNSQNFGFGYYRNNIDGDPDQPGTQPYNFGPGEFDVVMILKEKGKANSGGEKSRTVLHVVFDVGPAPAQTP